VLAAATIPALPAATISVITQPSQQSYETQLEKAVFLEQKFPQEDPNHCMDMNPSNDVKRLLREERSNNILMRMLATTITAGTRAAHEEHHISKKELLELMEAKNKKKEETERARLEKKMERETKIYDDGLAAKLKVVEHQTVVEDQLNGISDHAGRKEVIRKAKREKKGLNNATFLALIRFKTLGTNESKEIPTLRNVLNRTIRLVRIAIDRSTDVIDIAYSSTISLQCSRQQSLNLTVVP